MQRISLDERQNKAVRLESRGLSFHAWDNYWKETAAYKFTTLQVDRIEAASNELLHMLEEAGDYIVNNHLLGQLGIPPQFHEVVAASWRNEDPTLYGRFDFAYNGEGWPKMLEFNADTPTSLLESAVSQWDWLEDVKPYSDQFNALHEKLVAQWNTIVTKRRPTGVHPRRIHFASVSDNEEDWICVHYLMDTAVQAGFDVKHVFTEGLGFNHETGYFIDQDDRQIDILFKLYPLEWMMREDFGVHLLSTKTQLVEPLWKAMFSTKAILPILWKLYPDHRLLLPAYFEHDVLPVGFTSYARKPLFSREGANITLLRDGKEIATGHEQDYGAEGYVLQELIDLKEHDGFFPVVGAWVVGDAAAGMCIREDVNRITTNMSNFVPHFFE
ncbi:glutathionylspermidine synthase family protein [Oxalobacteraceae sp. CFBP 8763]|nr:glutathionylspermidine synthase family protein [Oxalobacteraceae sp. CFBP 8763]